MRVGLVRKKILRSELVFNQAQQCKFGKKPEAEPVSCQAGDLFDTARWLTGYRNYGHCAHDTAMA